MGNGADKLMARFALYGITISDFFASDGFVRGHSFHGFKILSFSEIRDKYTDFVIVISFASNKPDVIDMLSKINAEYDVYIPDMPVADVTEYFDKDFFNLHYEEIISAYAALEDEDSRNAFAAIINYKLSGRMDYLLSAYSTTAELYGELPLEKIERIIDAGAYNGDTVREAKSYFPSLKEAIAIEPDKKNFKKLAKYCEAETDISLRIINSAAWKDSSVGLFSTSGNRNASITATPSFEHSDDRVPTVRIDSLTDERIDYIKYDVEGAEREALLGSEELIKRYRPALLISLYHRSRDIFSIVNDMKERYPFYRFILRRLRCLPAWEIDLLAINREDINLYEKT